MEHISEGEMLALELLPKNAVLKMYVPDRLKQLIRDIATHQHLDISKTVRLAVYFAFSHPEFENFVSINQPAQSHS